MPARLQRCFLPLSRYTDNTHYVDTTACARKPPSVMYRYLLRILRIANPSRPHLPNTRGYWLRLRITPVDLEVNLIRGEVCGSKDVRRLQFFTIVEKCHPAVLTTRSAGRIVGELVLHTHKLGHIGDVALEDVNAGVVPEAKHTAGYITRIIYPPIQRPRLATSSSSTPAIAKAHVQGRRVQ